MKSPWNWQAYEAGTLKEVERARHEADLANHPAAAADYQAFQAFRQAIRDAGTRVVVPESRLVAQLKQVRKTPASGTRITPRVLLPVAAAFAIAFTIWWSIPLNAQSSVRLDVTPVQWTLQRPDATEAARKSAITLNAPMPAVSLAAVGAELEKTECGNCWMANTYRINDEVYKLYGKRSAYIPEDAPKEVHEGHVFTTVPEGIMWKCKNNNTFLLTGGSDGNRMKVARAAAKETPNLVQG